MHDNPQAVPAPVFALPNHRLIALSGRDAATFAQAQFMNDVAALQAGCWQWNGWLTPKGRLVALFALLKMDEENLWLVLPDADTTSLVTSLQRFVFRAKVKITVREDLRVQGAFAAPARARDNALALEGDVTELDFGADGGARLLRIVPAEPLHAPDDADSASRWAAFDLSHGLPRLPASQLDHWTPQQLSLDRLRAYSVKKGCYPGQEIVARTHFLGQAKRRLALLECERGVAPGEDVTAEAATIGTVVASADNAGEHLALAVVPLEAPGSLRVGAAPAIERPLLEGLAR